jgi:hypothetical protein
MKKIKHPTSNIQHSTPNEPGVCEWVLHDGGNGHQKFDLEERLLKFVGCSMLDAEIFKP